MRQVCEAIGLSRDRILCDHDTVPEVSNGEPVLLPYCDNSHLFGTVKAVVDAASVAIQTHLEQAGFEVHEVDGGPS